MARLRSEFVPKLQLYLKGHKEVFESQRVWPQMLQNSQRVKVRRLSKSEKRSVNRSAATNQGDSALVEIRRNG